MCDNILYLLALNSLFIYGLKAITYWEYNKLGLPTEKKLLWFLSYYAQKYYPGWFHKPLISCPICMASFWGVMFFLTLSNFSLFLLPIYCVTLAGLNSVIYARID